MQYPPNSVGNSALMNPMTTSPVEGEGLCMSETV